MDKIKIAPCRVELVRIKFTPTVKLPTLQTNQDLIALGEHFTRSKLKTKKRQKNRRPRDASTNIDYYEDTPSSGDNKKPKRKRINNKPPADGLSASRMGAQLASTGTPAVRLPPLETDKTTDPQEDNSARVSIAPIKVSRPEDEPSRGKGTFATRSFTLKKTKRHRKYRCKLCIEVLDSAHLLTVHHQQKHGILYCDECNKAFNNPTSLVRHKYQHKELRFHCNCGASFAFHSQLQTHSIAHRRHASHRCVYPNCNKSFKNKGDLTRHAAEHTGKQHECPDCDYKNTDIRNLESHRLKHSEINRYMCTDCGETFKYNTQLRRHHNNPKKCKSLKRSNSPDY